MDCYCALEYPLHQPYAYAICLNSKQNKHEVLLIRKRSCLSCKLEEPPSAAQLYLSHPLSNETPVLFRVCEKCRLDVPSKQRVCRICDRPVRRSGKRNFLRDEILIHEPEPWCQRLRGAPTLDKETWYTHKTCFRDFVESFKGQKTCPEKYLAPFVTKEFFDVKLEVLGLTEIIRPAYDGDSLVGVAGAEQCASLATGTDTASTALDENTSQHNKSMPTEPSKLESLPSELMQMVLAELDPRGLKRLSYTCHAMRSNISCLQALFVVLDITDCKDYSPLQIVATCDYEWCSGSSESNAWRLGSNVISIQLSHDGEEYKRVAEIRVHLLHLSAMLRAIHASLLMRRSTEVKYGDCTYDLEIVRTYSQSIRDTMETTLILCGARSDNAKWRRQVGSSLTKGLYGQGESQAALLALAVLRMFRTEASITEVSSHKRSLLESWRRAIPSMIAVAIRDRDLCYRTKRRYATLLEASLPYFTREEDDEVLTSLNGYLESRGSSGYHKTPGHDGPCSKDCTPAEDERSFDGGFPLYFVIKVSLRIFEKGTSARKLQEATAIKFIRALLHRLGQHAWHTDSDTPLGSKHLNKADEMMLLGQCLWLSGRKLIDGDMTKVPDLKQEWLYAVRERHRATARIRRISGTDSVNDLLERGDTGKILTYLEHHYKDSPSQCLVLSHRPTGGEMPLKGYCRLSTGLM